MLMIEQPLIGAINGDAVGLGATIALFCDVVIAAEKARFGDPHVKVGIVAEDGGAIIWPALIAVSRAKEFLMTGKLINAVEAEKIGLINHAVPPEDVLPKARACHGACRGAYLGRSLDKGFRQQVAKRPDEPDLGCFSRAGNAYVWHVRP